MHRQNQILGVDDRNNWNELQSNFCGVVIVRPYSWVAWIFLNWDRPERHTQIE
jgi:hypothetical protein